MFFSYLSKKSSILQRFFGIDYRSLTLFRVGLALVVLFDLMVRSADITAFYSDAGVLPRAVIFSQMPSSGVVSLHFISGLAFVEAFLLIVQVLCAIALLLGYRTRLMICLSWFLMASLQRRNPLILGGADNYLRMLLFWGMFVPLEGKYSWDAWQLSLKRPLAAQPTVALSWGTAAILLQTVFVYVFTALYKWRGNLWQNGDALYYTFQLDLYAKEITGVLLQFPDALKVMTHGVLWFESIGPFLLFFPLWTAPIRTIICLCFIFMQLGFNSLLYLELFPAVSAVAMILFLPSWFWDRWAYPFFKALRVRRTDVSSSFTAPVIKKESFLKNLIAGFLLFFVLFWLLAQADPLKFKVPPLLNRLGNVLYIHQAWKMFAPNPAKVSGWVVAPGTLSNGTVTDISRNGEPLNWEKPSKQSLFRNERWRKYFIHMVLKKNRQVAFEYADYLCRNWNTNDARKEKLKWLDIIVISRKTPVQGQSGIYNEKELLHYNCP